MAISTHWVPSPVTRPAHSPSMVARPSSLRPSSEKNEMAASRDSTTMPTLSIRLRVMSFLSLRSRRFMSACNTAGISPLRSTPGLTDNPIGALQHRVRNRHTELTSDFQIDYELAPGDYLERSDRWVRASQHLVNDAWHERIAIRERRSVGHQSTGRRGTTPEHRWQAMCRSHFRNTYAIAEGNGDLKDNECLRMVRNDGAERSIKIG